MNQVIPLRPMVDLAQTCARLKDLADHIRWLTGEPDDDHIAINMDDVGIGIQPRYWNMSAFTSQIVDPATNEFCGTAGCFGGHIASLWPPCGVPYGRHIDYKTHAMLTLGLNHAQADMLLTPSLPDCNYKL